VLRNIVAEGAPGEATSFSSEESAAAYFAPAEAGCGPFATAIGASLLGAPQRGGSCTSSAIGVLEWQAPIAEQLCAARLLAVEKTENRRLQVAGAGKGMGLETSAVSEGDVGANCVTCVQQG
jgi:hypothetical protein